MTCLPQIGNLDLEFIGKGSRRECYRLQNQDVCVKFYRDPAAMDVDRKARLSQRLHVFAARFVRGLNTNIQEWRYHQALKRQLPSDLLAVFPERIEPVYSAERGWGIIESLVLNPDGSLARSVQKELANTQDQELRMRLYRETERLLGQLSEYAVCFFDPPNILVQWLSPDSFRLRIVDFEPSGKEIVPGLSYVKPYVRSKVRRRSNRYLNRLHQMVYGAADYTRQRGSGEKSRGDHSWFGQMVMTFAQKAGLL